MAQQHIELDPGESVLVKAKKKGKPPGPEPPEPADPGHPNEPPGLMVLHDWAMTDPIPPGPAVPDPYTPGDPMYDDEMIASGPFRIAYNHPPGSVWPNHPDFGEWAGTPMGWCKLADDGKRTEFWYPVGMRMGNAPCTIYHEWGNAPNYRRMYVSVRWTPSAPFDNDNLGSKLWFGSNGLGGRGGQMFTGYGASGLTLLMFEYPDPDPSTPAYRIRWPNVNETIIVQGQEHLFEVYLEMPETSATPGLARWWIDGVLQGHYTDVWNLYPFEGFQFSATWGGNGPVFKGSKDCQAVRDLRVSVGQLLAVPPPQQQTSFNERAPWAWAHAEMEHGARKRG